MKTIHLLSSIVAIVVVTLSVGGIYPPAKEANAMTDSKAVETIQKDETNIQSSGPTKVAESLPTIPAEPLDNETIIWNYFINHGYSRNQTAGIMGNLMQEHHFKTSDVPGGLGIAQWIGGRRDNLIARGNYLDLTVQLDFLLYELNNSEVAANQAILWNDSLENSVIAFQNKFERCGICMESQRINYAYQILNSH